MSLIDQLAFSSAGKLPVLLQTEATECGVACIAMVASYHGYRTDVATLRRRFPVSLHGAKLNHLIRIASELKLATRPVKLLLEDIDQLKMPCILHWNFNHFVVLKSVSGRQAIVHDPAMGERRLSLDEVGKAFTGVALELWPAAGFEEDKQVQTIKLRQLMGQIKGLRGSMVQILLLALVLEVFALTSPLFMQWVLDNVIPSRDGDLLTLLAIGFFLLMLVQQAISTLRSWVILYFGTTLSVQWRANVFTHLIHLPVDYFNRRHLGDIVSRFGSIDAIQNTLTTTFLAAILDGLMTVLVVFMMFLYAPDLAWVSIAAMTLYALVRWIWYRPLRLATEEQIVHSAKQSSHFLETIRGARAIKLFGRQEERRASWLALMVDEINAGLRGAKLGIWYGLVNGLIFGIENIIIIWLGATMVMNGDFTVGVLIAFMSYKGMFGGRVGGLIDKFVELKMLRIQSERLSDIVLTETEQLSQSGAVSFENQQVAPSIEVTNLRFRYSEHEPWVLDGVSFKIPAGQSVAFVGPSGCGKSTLINILLGILPPTEGEIKIGGIPMDALGLETLRSMVGTVMQDDVLFAGSLSDNISFFDPQSDFARIEQSAKLAAIHDDIQAKPMRYNTLVGDMGTVLSGGQKQRVLLARALYKQPSILVLDEATSHLDVEREHQVNAAINSLKITRLIVAHRPETIATAERVMVLGMGRILQDSRLVRDPTTGSMTAMPYQEPPQT
ncbi:MAG: peptidase domain-containing ABC transporter [Pseudomonadota bacterium]|nr:peptidase domain-containing ABC transporter [Pseudomonadota bacterium]